MVVQLPHDHHCAWRERALELERRVAEIAEVAARQQTLLGEQQKLITDQAARQAELERKLGEQQAEHEQRVAELQHQVSKLEHQLVGKKSEKLKVTPHERDHQREQSDEEKARRREEAERKRRERALARDAALATEDVEHPIPDDMQAYPSCGGTEHDPLPDEETTRIDYVPGRFVKRRHRRKKIVRKCSCPKTSIVVAPGPPTPIVGGLYEASFIAFLIVEKCADSMPIYRMERRFARLGVPISRSTMNDLVLAAAERVRPLVTRLTTRMASVEVVLADETSMRLQDRSKRGFVWVFHGHDDTSGGELVLYVFSCDRSGDTPAMVLGASEGSLLVDGYKRDSQSVIEEIGRWCRKTYDSEPPRSELAKAIFYVIHQWRALTRFLEDGALPLDNTLVERTLRGVAMGRRNYLFAGSDQGALRAATIYTITATCRLNGVEPLAYFTDVLTKLQMEHWPHGRLRELLPDEWRKTAPPSALVKSAR